MMVKKAQEIVIQVHRYDMKSKDIEKMFTLDLGEVERDPSTRRTDLRPNSDEQLEAR
jgi:hypothetical protein